MGRQGRDSLGEVGERTYMRHNYLPTYFSWQDKRISRTMIQLAVLTRANQMAGLTNQPAGESSILAIQPN